MTADVIDDVNYVSASTCVECVECGKASHCTHLSPIIAAPAPVHAENETLSPKAQT